MDKFFSISWFVLLLLFILICLDTPPRNPPGASPALAQGASAGGQPVELPAPLTYSERFSSDAIGPGYEPKPLSARLGQNDVCPHTWGADVGVLPLSTRCLLSKAHVEEQGIGE